MTRGDLDIDDFSGEGQYVVHYSIDDLTKSVGTPEDDAANTLTARLLLLLEGTPLVGQSVYLEVIDEVISAYWGDFEDHKANFKPAFLANDILRLWRTFCVNYEARGLKDTPQERAKRKLQNYKLKHSRMLTCYSALLMLLFHFIARKTVTPGDTRSMVLQTPTERLEWLLKQRACESAHPAIVQLLTKYETFLSITDAPKNDLIDRFSDHEFVAARFEEASAFGESMYDALSRLGQGNPFYRLLVV